MRVGANQGIGIRDRSAVYLRCEDHACEVLEIHLVADTHTRGHSGEVAEGGLTPLEEGVTLAVALKLKQRVLVVGVGRTELVHLHGVVDDQLGGNERVHTLGVAAKGLDGVAHSAEVDDRGHAGEVLHKHARGHVGDLAAGLGLGVPLGKELNVPCCHVNAVLAAQQVFEQDLEAEGQTTQIEAARGKRGEAVDGVRAAA